MDDLPAPEPVFRSDALREHVDKLPKVQKHIIERCYFGGADLLSAAAEIGISGKQARDARTKGLETLKKKVLKDHEMGTMPPAPLSLVADIPVSST